MPIPLTYQLYRRGDPRGRPFHVVNDVELTAARAVTTLNNKRFNPFKAAPRLRGEVARRQSGVTEGADVSDTANISIIIKHSITP